MTWNRMMMIVDLLCALMGFYVVTRVRRFSFIKNYAVNHPFLSWLFPILAVACFAGIVLLVSNNETLFVVMLHLMFAFLLTDLVFLFLPKGQTKNLQCIIGLGLALLVLIYGWFNVFHVFRTSYDVTTDKNISSVSGEHGDGKESLRVVAISDAHLGISLSGKNFQRHSFNINGVRVLIHRYRHLSGHYENPV